MQELIIEIVNQCGYIGIALLIAVENLFPPIPSEVILTFGGFLTTCTQLHIWGVIAASTVGSVIGAIILYSIGKLIPPEALEKLLSGKVGTMLRVDPQAVYRAKDWFNSKGNMTVFFCRFIPIIRSLISIPAGMARMPFGLFALLTTVGSAIWNIVLVGLGAVAGESWGKVVDYMGTYAVVGKRVLIGMALLCMIGALAKRSNKNKKKGN